MSSASPVRRKTARVLPVDREGRVLHPDIPDLIRAAAASVRGE